MGIPFLGYHATLCQAYSIFYERICMYDSKYLGCRSYNLVADCFLRFASWSAGTQDGHGIGYLYTGANAGRQVQARGDSERAQVNIEVCATGAASGTTVMHE